MMNPWKTQSVALLTIAACLLLTANSSAQVRPYIGYTYPAGGRQGATFSIKLGGQGLDDVNGVTVSGSGVSGKIVEYHRRLNNQEVQLLNEQLRELRKSKSPLASMMSPAMTSDSSMMMMSAMTEQNSPGIGNNLTATQLIAKIERRTRAFVQTPACASLSSLVIVEVDIATNALPGARELRLITPRGISNPLVFHVGQVPEYSRKPMTTAILQVLGKEAQALRKRPADEVEDRISLPCTVNGQIASGEVNRYRFEARKGQKLVLSTWGRQLIPYIADAVPGWFQPVLAIYDSQGRELAFADDYRFKPDPTLLFEVPKDGEYVFAIYDSIYRGREDFVYRVTVGELPFVTSIFPLGGQIGKTSLPKMSGWNLQDAQLKHPSTVAGLGTYLLTPVRNGFHGTGIPFAVDALPNRPEKEPNNTASGAQKIMIPVTINGRINKPDDWDVFRFFGHSSEVVTVEVQARRLDSPMDSVIKVTDTNGTVLAFSDDREDLGAGINTHHADSWLTIKLPADGFYCVHIGDTSRNGGEEYAYRLRISPPYPDFALRMVPSSVSLRGKSSTALTVYASRKEGYNGPIRLTLKDPPPGFSAAPVILSGTQTLARFTFKCDLASTPEPVTLNIIGTAKIDGRDVVHEAVPAEDRMQAFLWRHLVPAADLKVLAFDPAQTIPTRRIARLRPTPAPAPNTEPVPSVEKPATPTNATAIVATDTSLKSTSNTNTTATNTAAIPAKPKFTKQQITGRLRQLKLLFEEGLVTDDFYNDKVAELDAAQ